MRGALMPAICIDYSITYGLPGKLGYRYRRPFDYFHFEFTAVPNASSAGNAIENVSIRGLLVGASYEAGEAYRGVWGLFGGYDAARTPDRGICEVDDHLQARR